MSRPVPVEEIAVAALISGEPRTTTLPKAAAAIIEGIRNQGHKRNADLLEQALSSASHPVDQGDVVTIQTDVWRRIKAATGYTFECDAQVAEAVEGLLKETRLAMPYANALEDFEAVVVRLTGIYFDEGIDPLEAWRRFTIRLRAGLTTSRAALGMPSEGGDGEFFSAIYAVVSERNRLAADADDLVHLQRDVWSTIVDATGLPVDSAPSKVADAVGLLAPEREASPHGVTLTERQWQRCATAIGTEFRDPEGFSNAIRAFQERTQRREKSHIGIIEELKAELARVNGELDAMAQRAVSESFTSQAAAVCDFEAGASSLIQLVDRHNSAYAVPLSLPPIVIADFEPIEPPKPVDPTPQVSEAAPQVSETADVEQPVTISTDSMEPATVSTRSASDPAPEAPTAKGSVDLAEAAKIDAHPFREKTPEEMIAGLGAVVPSKPKPTNLKPWSLPFPPETAIAILRLLANGATPVQIVTSLGCTTDAPAKVVAMVGDFLPKLKRMRPEDREQEYSTRLERWQERAKLGAKS